MGDGEPEAHSTVVSGAARLEADKAIEHGLAIHPDKTRLVPFRRPSTPKDDTSSPGGGGTGGNEPGTFDLLGFTHFWAISRKRNWVVKRKTASSRLSAVARSASEWLARNAALADSNRMSGSVSVTAPFTSFCGVIDA